MTSNNSKTLPDIKMSSGIYLENSYVPFNWFRCHFELCEMLDNNFYADLSKQKKMLKALHVIKAIPALE